MWFTNSATLMISILHVDVIFELVTVGHDVLVVNERELCHQRVFEARTGISHLRGLAGYKNTVRVLCRA